MLKNAMVLAAGLGTRMRPITDTIPKPLVRVHQKTLLDHALDALGNAGVERAVVNVHYLAPLIESHVNDRSTPQVVISDETAELLDSGGGVKKAIELLGTEPFFILNADSFWVDGYVTNLSQMADCWDPQSMDMMLLVAPRSHSVGFDGKGDFFMAGDGRLTRRGDADAAPYVYAGAIIAKPEGFHGIVENRFSLNRLFDQAITRDRLFGSVLDGLWLHVGTPDAIGEAEAAISQFKPSS